MRRAIIFSIVYLLGIVPVFSGQVFVKKEEIKSLLTGNTIQGTWFGEEYRQYFKPGGYTIYSPKNSQELEGKWRVNEKTDEYESWWEQSGWSKYRIIRQNGELYWLGSNTEPQPFLILPGNQLKWPETN